MGEIFGKKEFVIANDGTIIRGDPKGNKRWLITLVILISVVAIGVVVYMTSNGWDHSTSYYESDELHDTVPVETIEEVYPESEENIPDGYVDLGLPSGTLCKIQNENRYYDYDKAVSTFGCQLPTNKQWMELVKSCEWTWGNNGESNGYVVKGTNNNSIFLPVENLLVEGWIPDDEIPDYEYKKDNMECCENDDMGDSKYCGSYISSDIEDYAPWIFYFDDDVIVGNYDPVEYCGVWHSVRLVYNKRM